MYRIIPESAHSAYDKAAQYFNIKLWRVPVNKEFQADVKAIRRFVNKNTILVCAYSLNLFSFNVCVSNYLGLFIIFQKAYDQTR